MYLESRGRLMFIETVTKPDAHTLKIENSSLIIKYKYSDPEDTSLAFDILYSEMNGGRHIMEYRLLPEPTAEEYIRK